MSELIGKQKAALRHRVRTGLNRVLPGSRAEASAQACSRLQRQQVWREARSVLLYVPLADELDIGPLLREALTDKDLALPRFNAQRQMYVACRVSDLSDDLRAGQFGILEPEEGCPEVALNQLDFLLAPGVAFACDGRRLGRGRGFYDRLLAVVRGVKCGIGFDEQIVDVIPIDQHDILLDYILTPRRWIQAGQGANLK